MERPSMEEEEEEIGDELQQQVKQLVEEWNSFKQSNPERVQHCWGTPTPTPSSTSVRYRSVGVGTWEDKLGGDMISCLEQRPHDPHPPTEGGGGGGWKVRNNDLVVEEILRERKVAIESGKLKGRRLFDLDYAPDEASTRDLDFNIRWGEDMCSGCSSVLIQASEVRSICSSSSSSSTSTTTSAADNDNDDHDDKDDDAGHINGFGHDDSLGGYFHLSSPSTVSPRKVERDNKAEITSVGVKRGGGGNGERGMVLMGCLAIVLMLFALGIISLKSFEEFGDQQSFDSLIPT